MKRVPLIMMAALLTLSLAACSSRPFEDHALDGDGMEKSYRQISQEEAMEMMKRDDGHIIVDVRRQDEFDTGHIPGAICIPNESIDDQMPEELPDRDQIILVYCRSGNRSKQASTKLFRMGYSNVYEFGGINTWPGEIVTDEAAAEPSENPEPEENQPEENQAEETHEEETREMKLIIGDTRVPVTWEENESVAALAELTKDGPLTIQMSMYGGFEQVGEIGQSIVRNDSQTTTDAGDIVLYSGNQIVVFYGSNSWAYTRLGHVELTQKEMENLLGNGDITLTLTSAGDD